MSVFIVVFMAILTTSALNNLPVIFLRLAENQNGEFDLKLEVTTSFSSLIGTSLNVSAIRQSIIKGAGESIYNQKYKYHSPRFAYSAKIFDASSCTYANKPLPYQNETEFRRWVFTALNSSDTTLESCWTKADGCLLYYCPNRFDTQFRAIDTELELQMSFGSNFPFEAPKDDEIYITSQLGSSLGLGINDTVLIQTYSTGNTLLGPYIQSGIVANNVNTALGTNVILNLRIAKLLPEKYGKASAFENNIVFTNFASFYKQIARNLHARVSDSARQNLTRVNPYEYAHQVYFNVPPTRLDSYNYNDYSVTQAVVTGFVGEILYFTGFDQVSTSMPVLAYMYNTRFFGLFLGLILNMILTVLTILSIVLIYSLLLINVETKQFEMGVLRMLGVKKFGIFQLILMQALLYSIPGTILGLVAGILAYFGMSFILSAIFQTAIRRIATETSIIQALIMGLLIPVFSSIIPIYSALSYQLRDSLDTSKSRTVAVIYKIERSTESVDYIPLIIGGCLTVFGFLIYYTFPLSLLSFNLSILLYMFFGVLIAMLLGLVVLGLNIETILNKFVTYLFFFWENNALRGLILKNLTAHRIRNRKTTIIYSITLGFIIFLSVSFNIQVMSYQYDTIQGYGTRFNIDSTSTSARHLNNPVIWNGLMNIIKTDPIVQSYTYFTYRLNEVSSLTTNIKNTGLTSTGIQQIRGIAPNFFKVLRSNFLKISTWNPSGYFIDTELYTKGGADAMIIGETYYDLIGLDKRQSDYFVLETVKPTELFPLYKYRLRRPLCFLNAAPGVTFSYFPDTLTQTNLVSMPAFVRLSNGTFSGVSQAPIKTLFVEVKSSATSKEIDAFKRKVNYVIQGRSITLYDVEDELSALYIPVQVMNFMFLLITIVAMVMCFFSLFSSMYTNVYGQSKEMGILRSMGVSRLFIFRMYIYEAFVLVISASIIGIVVGTIIAYTLVIQQILFTQLPLDFAFPWDVTLLVFGLAILFSIIAAVIPTCQLIFLPIIAILKRVIT